MSHNNYQGQNQMGMGMGMGSHGGQGQKHKKVPNPQNYKIVKCINFENST